MRLLIVGAGGHAKVVVDAARAASIEVAGALGRPGDPDTVLGIPVITDASSVDADCFIVAIGDNGVRARRFSEFSASGLPPANVIHPSAVIGSNVDFGQGVFVAAGVVVNACAQIGDDSVLNTGCTVDHDCRVGAHALVGPGASLCGGASVGEGVTLGAGACVVPGASVGTWTVVGAGAAVTNDLPSESVCVGVPATPIRRIGGHR